MKTEGQKSSKGLTGSLSWCRQKLEPEHHLPSSGLSEENKLSRPTLLIDHIPSLAHVIPDGFSLHPILLERLLVPLPPSYGVLSRQTILLALLTFSHT